MRSWKCTERNDTGFLVNDHSATSRVVAPQSMSTMLAARSVFRPDSPLLRKVYPMLHHFCTWRFDTQRSEIYRAPTRAFMRSAREPHTGCLAKSKLVHSQRFSPARISLPVYNGTSLKEQHSKPPVSKPILLIASHNNGRTFFFLEELARRSMYERGKRGFTGH